MHKLFENMGMISSGILNLSPRETNEICSKGAIIVDVREEYLGHFKILDVNEVFFCPLSELGKNYLELPKDKALIFADSVGIHSKEAVKLIKEKGYDNVANLAGGLVEWERQGMPTVIDKSERLTGSCACMLKKREKK